LAAGEAEIERLTAEEVERKRLAEEVERERLAAEGVERERLAAEEVERERQWRRRRAAEKADTERFMASLETPEKKISASKEKIKSIQKIISSQTVGKSEKEKNQVLLDDYILELWKACVDSVNSQSPEFKYEESDFQKWMDEKYLKKIIIKISGKVDAITKLDDEKRIKMERINYINSNVERIEEEIQNLKRATEQSIENAKEQHNYEEIKDVFEKAEEEQVKTKQGEIHNLKGEMESHSKYLATYETRRKKIQEDIHNLNSKIAAITAEWTIEYYKSEFEEEEGKKRESLLLNKAKNLFGTHIREVKYATPLDDLELYGETVLEGQI
tara:strand:+ start:75 stop:1061 length:987 start_codon:yes stop_codon:yes gene_type:complete